MTDGAQMARLILVTQFAVTVLVCVCTAVFIPINEPVAGCIIGLISVQILLAAVWAAMGSSMFWFRISCSAVATLFLTACFYRVAWRDGSGHAVALSISLPMILFWVLVQVPLWTARFMGWRIGIPTSEDETAAPHELQFGIKQLLIWTTVVAVSIAVVKNLIHRVETSGLAGMGLIDLGFGIYLTIGTSLIALPLIWGAFVNRHAWAWFVASFFMCIAVTTLQVLIAYGGGDYTLVLFANIVQTILSIVTMLLVRKLGHRLFRVPRTLQQR